MRIVRRIKGNKAYYYLQHSFRKEGKVVTKEQYLGKDIPSNIDDIKDDLEYKALKTTMIIKLRDIKAKFIKEQAKLPKQEKEKLIEDFLVHFVFDSSKIEGGSLTLNDTKGLFLHNITPKSKPAKDVKEAESYRKACYSMLDFKGKLSLKAVNRWHEMMFKETRDYIGGKIRTHRIMVSGSRAAFPHPEDVSKLLNKFFNWYGKEGQETNPVELAALAHLKFVSIHPYTDGNGRISRLLANYVLKSHGYPMLNIKFKDRMAYYKSLESSQINEKPKYFLILMT